MKKIVALFVTAIMMLSLCMCFTACSNATSYVGKYEFEFMFLSVKDADLNYESGKTYGDVTLNGNSVVLYINEDKTWSMDTALPEFTALEDTHGVWKDGFGRLILRGYASDSEDTSASTETSASADAPASENTSASTETSVSVETSASENASASADASASENTSASEDASASEEAPKEKEIAEYDITATLNNGNLVVDFKDGGNWVRFSLKKVKDISYLGTYNFKSIYHSTSEALDKKMKEDTVFVVQEDGRWYFDSSRDKVYGNWMAKDGKLTLEVRKSTNGMEQEKVNVTFEFKKDSTSTETENEKSMYLVTFADSKTGDILAEYEFTKAE